MAAVIFSSVGQALGGPFGAFAGALAGSALDAAIGRRGDRSAVEQVQRSAYGVAIPRVFGTARVAGVLVWAHVTDQGAKGSGQRAGAASLAVALSSRPIADVVRIWADGREIRNAAGVFETPITMRVHGGRNAVPDPIIAAVEGIGLAPAYDGLAYVVFEDLSLEPFGNRIPNLSFEVVADGDSVGAWAGEMSGLAADAPGAAPDWAVAGYVGSGRRIGDDLEPMLWLAGTHLGYGYGRLGMVGETVLHVVPRADLLAEAAERASGYSSRPSGLCVGYMDPQRDYQAGLQRAARSRAGTESEAILPAVMSSGDARMAAHCWLRDEELAAETFRLSLGWKWLGIAVGDRFRLADEAALWRVVWRSVRGLAVELRAIRCADRPSAGMASDSGRLLAMDMQVVPPTVVRAFELPLMQGGEPKIWVSANGESGWRGSSIGRLTSWGRQALGSARNRRPLGRLVEALGPGPALVRDDVSKLVVAFSDAGAVVESRRWDQVMEGANLLRVGGEYVQFRTATCLPGGVFELRGLLRDRFATVANGLAHPAGTEVEMIDLADLVGMPLSADMVGQALTISAEGRGDPPGGTAVEHVVTGAGLGRLAPVHFRCRRAVDGAVVASWTPRSRGMVDWGAADEDWGGGSWCFEAVDGFRFEADAPGPAISISLDEQVRACGGPFPPGHAHVVTRGEGPMAQRRSLSRFI